MAVLVSGATGTQGGAFMNALLSRKRGDVRALVRDPQSAKAQALVASGATLVVGTFEDGDALDNAMIGIDTVFSVQPAPYADPQSERRQAQSLVDAAVRAGVRHLIHSSVSNTGAFETMQGWAAGRWGRNYWESKRDAEAIVRSGDFAHVTILRPAFMMENFAPPKAHWMFPDLEGGTMSTALEPETRIALVAAQDIAAAALQAMDQTKRYDDQPLELAGDWLTMAEIAAVLARWQGAQITVNSVAPKELIARSYTAGWVETQEWMNVVGYSARPEMMMAAGLTPTTFDAWARSIWGLSSQGPGYAGATGDQST